MPCVLFVNSSSLPPASVSGLLRRFTATRSETLPSHFSSFPHRLHGQESLSLPQDTVEPPMCPVYSGSTPRGTPPQAQLDPLCYTPGPPPSRAGSAPQLGSGNHFSSGVPGVWQTSHGWRLHAGLGIIPVGGSRLFGGEVLVRFPMSTSICLFNKFGSFPLFPPLSGNRFVLDFQGFELLRGL